MSLEELLKSRTIMRTKPDHRLALNSITRAKRDMDIVSNNEAQNAVKWAEEFVDTINNMLHQKP